jgi:hypothetical protein
LVRLTGALDGKYVAQDRPPKRKNRPTPQKF